MAVSPSSEALQQLAMCAFPDDRSFVRRSCVGIGAQICGKRSSPAVEHNFQVHNILWSDPIEDGFCVALAGYWPLDELCQR